MKALIALTHSALCDSSSAYAFRTAFSWAALTAANIFSQRTCERACRCFSRGTSLSSISCSSGVGWQSSSTFFSFPRACKSSLSACLTSSSAAAATSLISVADNPLESRESRSRESREPKIGRDLPSVRLSVSSAASRNSSASSTTFCTACRCASSACRLSSCSLRSMRACASDLAMATFWCKERNLSRLTGSRIRIILLRASSGNSNSCTDLLNAKISIRFS